MMYTIITQDNCSHCDRAKALLRDNNISTVTYNVGASSSRWVFSLVRMAGLKTVPQIFNDKGEHVGGYNDLVQSLGLDPTLH